MCRYAIYCLRNVNARNIWRWLLPILATHSSYICCWTRCVGGRADSKQKGLGMYSRKVSEVSLSYFCVAIVLGLTRHKILNMYGLWDYLNACLKKYCFEAPTLMKKLCKTESNVSEVLVNMACKTRTNDPPMLKKFLWLLINLPWIGCAAATFVMNTTQFSNLDCLAFLCRYFKWLTFLAITLLVSLYVLSLVATQLLTNLWHTNLQLLHNLHILYLVQTQK